MVIRQLNLALNFLAAYIQLRYSLHGVKPGPISAATVLPRDSLGRPCVVSEVCTKSKASDVKVH